VQKLAAKTRRVVLRREQISGEARQPGRFSFPTQKAFVA